MERQGRVVGSARDSLKRLNYVYNDCNLLAFIRSYQRTVTIHIHRHIEYEEIIIINNNKKIIIRGEEPMEIRT